MRLETASSLFASGDSRADSSTIEPPGLPIDSSKDSVYRSYAWLASRLKTWWQPISLTVLMLVVAMEIARLVSRGASGDPPIRSVAVLPLANLAPGGTEDYLADGMTEELITELGRVDSLRVISRTSVMRYKNTVLPLGEVTRSLDVNAVVEGTVQRVGDRIHITVQLIGISPEHNIWSNAYDGNLRDVLNLQSQVAQDIAVNVRRKLAVGRQVPARRSKQLDFATYEQYLAARHFLANRDTKGLEKAVEYFEEAVRRDPQYAQAYAGLAIAHNLLAMYDLRPSEDSFPRAKAFAARALELDSSLSEAYTARAAVSSFWDLDWSAANRDFQRAIALDASSSIAHQWYGEHFINVANRERAIFELQRARELDPLSLPVNAALGRVYHDAHDYDNALRQCRKALDLYPRFSMSHWCLGLAYLGKRDFPAAVSELERANDLGTTPLITRDLGRAYAAAGRTEEARRILNELRQKSKAAFVPSYLLSMIYGALGENDEAFKWLKQAYIEKDPHLPFLALDPEINGLRSDSRFDAFLQRLPVR